MSRLERVVYIDRTLREQGDLTVRSIAGRFEISPRQAKRDIEYMRDRLAAPISFDTHHRAYRYDAPFDDLRFADERMLLFYVLARSLATNETYIPVISAEILNDLEGHVAEGYRCLEDRIRYNLSLTEPIDMDLFSGLCDAMRNGRCLDIVYVDSAGAESRRRIESERLIHYSGKWYVVAYDRLRNALRTFHTARIRSLALTKEPVPKRTPQFERELDDYLDRSFGMFKGDVVERAIVRFYGKVAPLVANQRWHPDQIDADGTDSRSGPYLERSLPVADTSELLSRVLSFGASAEAVAPDHFRARWKEEISKMAERAGG
ncbi:MAG TPA: WYL domain-containing protein [Spirochaetia bacterium]|nr:WYL domain-containing protein [Spirochaetia bacterium]